MTTPTPSVGLHAKRHPLRSGVVLVVFLGVAAYVLANLRPLLFPRPLFNAAAEPGCDLNIEPCVAKFDETHALRLTLEPGPLTASRPLRLHAANEGIPATAARVEFSGVDMNMGRIEVPLQANDNGAFVTETTLPACIRRQMTWRAMITLDAGHGVYRATFLFDVNRH